MAGQNWNLRGPHNQEYGLAGNKRNPHNMDLPPFFDLTKSREIYTGSVLMVMSFA
jgi:hypothetical protein